MKGLYIHIPFCKYICTYCDFCKKFIDKYDVDEYLHYLEKEIKMYDITDINTIYIGGGTPSALSEKSLRKLLQLVNDYARDNKIIEYSFEMNPDDITEEKLEILKSFGVNRISIGIQSLNDDTLKAVNRNYTYEQVKNSVELVEKYFENISADFMFNLPNQKIEDIDFIMKYIEEKQFTHISFYSLIIEEHTVIRNQNFKGLNEEKESDMYKYIQTQLINNLKYNQYEISNFSKEEYQSKHNIHYWDLDEYIGIGLGASGYLDKVRYTNTKSVDNYYYYLDNDKRPVVSSEIISNEESEEEKIILSLRQNKLVAVNQNIINFIMNDKFLRDKIIIDNNKIKIKIQYYFISNEIILKLLEGNDD